MNMAMTKAAADEQNPTPSIDELWVYPWFIISDMPQYAV